MFLRGDTWHYDFVLGGVRYRGSTGFKKEEKKQAEATVERIKVQARDGHSTKMIWEQTKRRMIASSRGLDLTYEAIWPAFSKRSTGACSRRMAVHAKHLRCFCEWMKANYANVTRISDVLPLHANEWWYWLCAQTKAPNTKNDYLASIKMIFKVLGKDYGIVENPFGEIKKILSSCWDRKAFTPDELELIGKNATGWIYSLCITALSTGLREGDICMLLKSSVNLETGWISIPHTRKTGVPVDIPIMPGLRRHLAAAFESHPDSEYVFPELAEKYMRNSAYIGTEVKEFFDKIGIFGTTETVPGYQRAVSVKDIHSFRHTFVYLAAVHGIPFPIVQGIVGHTSPEMTKHYMDHAGREAKTKYLNQLPDYLAGTKKERKPKPLTADRVLRLIQRITPENLEKNKQRVKALLGVDIQ